MENLAHKSYELARKFLVNNYSNYMCNIIRQEISTEDKVDESVKFLICQMLNINILYLILDFLIHQHVPNTPMYCWIVSSFILL